jgi:nitrate/TMAO reductase-like tetraheme cytochrome c subunit
MSLKILQFLTDGHDAGMPWGNTLDLAMILSVALCAVILGCIIFCVIFYRGEETDARALWIGSVSLLIAPLLLLPVSNLTVFRYSQQVTFCVSCHQVMQPYVDQMHDPASRTMAARHYQDRFSRNTECYGCHARPGVYGTLEAKLTGLHEAYAFLAGTYHLPLKLAEPMTNQFCLRCHSDGRRFMMEDSHLDADGKIAHDLVTNAVQCEECHGPSHQVAHALKIPEVRKPI